MSDSENVVPFPAPAHKRVEPDVCFNRLELGRILSVYGRAVAAGEWRDYAISHTRDHSAFSIFRHASERPLYRIEKRPANASKQGAYTVFGREGQVLKRGRDLEIVLRVFNRILLKIADPR